jgi:histidinol-phosphate aminotransferase
MDGHFIQSRTRAEVFKLKPYVPGKPIEEVKRELGLDDVVKLASNENPVGPSPLGVQAIQANLSSLNLYPDANCYYLKDKIRQKFSVDINQVIVGNGSDELLMLIAAAFINPGDEVIMGQPSFAEYEFTSQIMGADLVYVPLDAALTYDLEAVVQAITPKTKIIYLCNPNNPTGTAVDKTKLAAFVQRIPDHALLIFDEAYYEYIDDPGYPSGLDYLNTGKNILVLRTFSKIFGLAALRVGFGIGSAELTGIIERVEEPFNVNMLAQVAATAALDDSAHLENSRKVNAAGKAYLYREMEALGCSCVPSQANFIFIRVNRDSKEVFEALLQAGVIIRPGHIFGYPDYIRVTIGTKTENERLVSALGRILS